MGKKKKHSKINYLKLAASIVICQLAGIIGSVFTYPSIPTWYAILAKPSLNPPNWVFAPVWLLLYTLMGISAYMIWEKGISKKEVKHAIYVFSAQLILNSLWSILFFGLRSPIAGLIDIVILWGLIIATIVLFFRISKIAGYLLIPYILWVSFAVYLNFAIWILN